MCKNHHHLKIKFRVVSGSYFLTTTLTTRDLHTLPFLPLPQVRDIEKRGVGEELEKNNFSDIDCWFMMHHEHMCAVNGPEGDGVPREETRGLRPQRGPRGPPPFISFDCSGEIVATKSGQLKDGIMTGYMNTKPRHG